MQRSLQSFQRWLQRHLQRNQLVIRAYVSFVRHEVLVMYYYIQLQNGQGGR